MLISVIAAFDVSNAAVFKTDMVHEAIAAMVISPFLDNDKVFDVAGLEMIFIIPIIFCVCAIVAVHAFFFADFNMVRFAALCEHFGFEITFSD